MTIIQPNKEKIKIWKLAVPLLAIILTGAYFSILFYNKSVDMNHALAVKEKELKSLQATNGELKNKVYAFSDPSNINKIVGAAGLTLDKRPVYLESKSDQLAKNL